jgi:hypothetical protein
MNTTLSRRSSAEMQARCMLANTGSEDPCVIGFCSRPPSASWRSCRRRPRRTGPPGVSECGVFFRHSHHRAGWPQGGASLPPREKAPAPAAVAPPLGPSCADLALARAIRQQCRAAMRDLLSEPPIEAEQVMPDVANIDAGSRLLCRAHQAPDQLCCRLIFLSASLAERSTRSRRSGISWLRSSSPSSRSAWSSSASGFVGLGQTIGLDFFALDKQRSRVAAGFKRPVGARSHANPCCSKGFRHGIATSLLRLRAAVMIMSGELTSSRSLVTAQRL